jgi:hypothetical protein
MQFGYAIKPGVSEKLGKLASDMENLEEKIRKGTENLQKREGKRLWKIVPFKTTPKKLEKKTKNLEKLYNEYRVKAGEATGGLEITSYNNEVLNAYRALNEQFDILARKFGALRYDGKELSSFAPERELVDSRFEDQKEALNDNPKLFTEYSKRQKRYERVQRLLNLGIELIKEAEFFDKPHLTTEEVKEYLNDENMEERLEQAIQESKQGYTIEQHVKGLNEKLDERIEESFDRLSESVQQLILNGWTEDEEQIQGYNEKRFVKDKELERRAKRLERISQMLEGFNENDVRFLSEMTQLFGDVAQFMGALPESYSEINFKLEDTFLTQDFFNLMWDYSRHVLQDKPHVRGGHEEGFFGKFSYVEAPLAYVNGLMTSWRKEFDKIAKVVHEKYKARVPEENKLKQFLREKGSILGHLFGRPKKDKGEVSPDEQAVYAINHLLNYEGSVSETELNETFNSLEALNNVEDLPIRMSGDYWSLLESSVRRAIEQSRNINERLSELTYNSDQGMELNEIIEKRANRTGKESLSNKLGNYLQQRQRNTAEETQRDPEGLPDYARERGIRPNRSSWQMPEGQGIHSGLMPPNAEGSGARPNRSSWRN